MEEEGVQSVWAKLLAISKSQKTRWNRAIWTLYAAAKIQDRDKWTIFFNLIKIFREEIGGYSLSEAEKFFKKFACQPKRWA